MEWEQNLDLALSYNPPHLSAYALTVEKKTVLSTQIKNKEVLLLPEEAVENQYQLMVRKMTDLGYVNYEFSNFGKPHFFSMHNRIG